MWNARAIQHLWDCSFPQVVGCPAASKHVKQIKPLEIVTLHDKHHKLNSSFANSLWPDYLQIVNLLTQMKTCKISISNYTSHTIQKEEIGIREAVSPLSESDARG